MPTPSLLRYRTHHTPEVKLLPPGGGDSVSTDHRPAGDNLFCPVFQIPLNLPCSVTLQPGPEDTGKVTTLP